MAWAVVDQSYTNTKGSILQLGGGIKGSQLRPKFDQRLYLLSGACRLQRDPVLRPLVAAPRAPLLVLTLSCVSVTLPGRVAAILAGPDMYYMPNNHHIGIANFSIGVGCFTTN